MLKAHNQQYIYSALFIAYTLIIKKGMRLSSTKIFEASQTNSVDPDQTAPVGAV